MAARNYTALPTRTTLASAITTTVVTNCTVTSAANFPAAPFTAVIERGLATEEVVLVTAVSGTTFTITRGYDGTVAANHALPSTIEHCTSAIDDSEANTHINATTNIHGSTGALVDIGSAQTITKGKTIQTSDGLLDLAIRARLTAGGGQSTNLLEFYDVAAALQAYVDPTGIINSSKDIQAGARSLSRGWLANGQAAITASTTMNITTTTFTAVTGLAITVTVSTARRYMISFNGQLMSSVAADQMQFQIFDSTNAVILYQCGRIVCTTASVGFQANGYVEFVPSASGSVTYQIRIAHGTGTGNGNVAAGATFPAFILIEDVGPSV